MRHKDREYFEVMFQNRFFRIELEVLHDHVNDCYIASVELISDDCKNSIELFNQTYNDIQPAIIAVKKIYNSTIRRLYANVKESSEKSNQSS
jgi:hypothetical protein